MRKLWLLSLLLLLIPIASAFGSCTNVTLSVTEPESKNYSYSINLPVTIAANANATNCWAQLTSSMYTDNVSLYCADDNKIDVDYDGDYTLQVFATNATSGESCNVTTTFSIDRTTDFEEGKPTMVAILVGVLLIVGFYALHFAKELDSKFKALMHALSFLFVYAALAFSLNIAREYIKVPAIFDLLENMFTVTAWAATLLGMIILVLFIANVFKAVERFNNKKDDYEW